ncbi:hypothetical protein IAU59_006329 [Kwoniella sp. CBS 9459]
MSSHLTDDMANQSARPSEFATEAESHFTDPSGDTPMPDRPSEDPDSVVPTDLSSAPGSTVSTTSAKELPYHLRRRLERFEDYMQTKIDALKSTIGKDQWGDEPTDEQMHMLDYSSQLVANAHTRVKNYCGDGSKDNQVAGDKKSVNTGIEKKLSEFRAVTEPFVNHHTAWLDGQLKTLQDAASTMDKDKCTLISSVLLDTKSRVPDVQKSEGAKKTFDDALCRVTPFVKHSDYLLGTDHKLRKTLAAADKFTEDFAETLPRVSKVLRCNARVYSQQRSLSSKLAANRMTLVSCIEDLSADNEDTAASSAHTRPSDSQLQSANRALDLIGQLQSKVTKNQEEFLRHILYDNLKGSFQDDLKTIRETSSARQAVEDFSEQWQNGTRRFMQSKLAWAEKTISEICTEGTKFSKSIDALNHAIRTGSLQLPTDKATWTQTALEDLPSPLKEYWQSKLSMKSLFEPNKGLIESCLAVTPDDHSLHVEKHKLREVWQTIGTSVIGLVDTVPSARPLLWDPLRADYS